MVYNWLTNAQHWLYPPRCALCDGAGDDGLDICAACRADLPWLCHACPLCALPLPAHAAVCPACRRQPPPFSAAVAALHYEAPADWLITRLKFHRQLSLARVLGSLLAARVAGLPRPDLLLPVPLHAARRRERGFNQAAEIAAATGKQLALPVAGALAVRSRTTARQADLPARQRRANVLGAFAAGPGVQGRDIAIIDDVVTTGHTAAELARTLKRAGAADVSLWTVARA